MKILAFIHTWAPDGDFDNYMTKLITAFENIGVELFVINSNKLINFKGKIRPNNKKRVAWSIKKLDWCIKRIIEKIKPDIILSTNRGGITKFILENFKSIPIITLMVDLMFFKSYKFIEKIIFQKNDHLITPSFASVKKFEKKFPVLKGRVHYLPFCTDINDFNQNTKKDINIVFIGNLFGSPQKILKHNKNEEEFRKGVFEFIREVEKNFHLDVNYYLKKFKLKERLNTMGTDPDKFLSLAAGIISNNNRIKSLEAVSDLGLRIYGPKIWSKKTIDYSYQLASCHQTEKYIKTRQQLCSIYDRSKIGINVNHHQATSGLGYRVFDVLASSALLITNFQKDSDLTRLFGQDHKIPTFRSPEELRYKAKYFLEHEDERKERVSYCNQLVANGFSFEERATQMIQIAEPSFVPYKKNKSKATYISIPKFYTWRI
jgi:spore maturation protein CgeB